MEIITILGAAVVAIGAISPIIVKYYNRADKYLTVVQMFLDGYREFLQTGTQGSDGGETRTDAEYITLGKKYEQLVLATDSAIDIPAFIK